MYVKFENIDGCLIVNLMGELDHHSAEEVRLKIDDIIEREEIKKLVLDFGGVTFMDSSGIGVVIGRYKKLALKGGRMYIAEVSKSVTKVFELAGLFKVIKNYNTVDEAVKAI